MNNYLRKYIATASRQSTEFKENIQKEYKILRYQIVKIKNCVNYILNETNADQDTQKTILGFSEFKGWNNNGDIDDKKFFAISDFYTKNKELIDNWNNFFQMTMEDLNKLATKKRNILFGYENEFIGYLYKQIYKIFMYIEDLADTVFSLACHKYLLSGFRLASSPLYTIYSIGEIHLNIEIPDKYKILNFSVQNTLKWTSLLTSLYSELL